MVLEIQFVQELLASWQQDQAALESFSLSLISFGSSARQDLPLSVMRGFKLPHLQASGFSALGKAFSLAASCFAREVAVSSPSSAEGDCPPSMILITGSRPTDNWQKGIKDVQAQRWNVLRAYAVPGSDIHPEMLSPAFKSIVLSGTAEEFCSHARSLAGEMARGDDGNGLLQPSECVGARSLPSPPPVIHVEL